MPSNLIFCLLALICTTGVFAIDLLTPLGISIGALHSLAILIALRSTRYYCTLIISFISSVFIFAAFVLLKDTADMQMFEIIINRCISLAIVWSVALLGLKSKIEKDQDALNRQTITRQKKALDEYALVCELDGDGHILQANELFCKVLNFRASELQGQDYRKVCPDFKTKFRFLDIYPLLKSDQIWRHELELQTKEGVNHWADVSFIPLLRAKGELKSCLAIHILVTERKRMIQKLFKQNQLLEIAQAITTTINDAANTHEAFQTALNQICRFIEWPVGHVYMENEDTPRRLESCGIWYLHDAQRYKDFKAVTEQTNLERGDGLPQKVWADNKPLWVEDVSNSEVFLRRGAARAAGIFTGMSFPVSIGSESVAVFEFYTTERIPKDQMMLDFFVIIGNQLSRLIERKRSEEIVWAGEKKLRSIIETASDAFVSMDVQGKVVDWNHRAEEIFGWNRAEVLGRSLPEIMVPEPSRQACHDGMKRYLKTGHSVVLHKRHEVTAIRKSGEEFPVELSIWPLGEGQETVFHAFIQDISQRKSLEAQFLQSQKMEGVGKLAGGIAHDFNNILTSLMGNSAFLKRKIDKLDPDQGQAMAVEIEEIIKAAKRAEQLTGQLLAFSRRQMMQIQNIDVNELVKNLQGMLERLIGENIKLNLTYAPAGVFARADYGQLEQVLVNLVINARDALPSGGHIHIRIQDDVVVEQNYVLDYARTSYEHYALISVSDDGCGMSEEVRRQIFEPFFTTKEKGKGTGLGLSTSFGIIKQFGGSITCYSEVGRGTIFKIYLQKASDDSQGKQNASLPQENESAASPENISVMIVEDDDAIRDFVVEALKSHGYKTLQARNGAEALKALAEMDEKGVDLVFSDVIMPVMGGCELAQAVRTRFPKTKVLLTSGYTGDHDMLQGELDSQVSILPKPYTEEQMIVKIKALLHNQ
ncbi:MAG: PAS domain S-box protein [Candidatus Omnitrophica bacterium]|nr:PAS domain S-box protein [Candidatus Omnitrophota bacterium]